MTMFDLDPPPAELQGRYRLLDEIGRGGMGQVYRVLDLRDGCERALKWVPGGDPVRAEETRHLREFSILARFEHPNILRVHEYGALEDRSGSFFTADLLQGPSLHRGGRNLPESDRITALCDLLRALAFLHRQGWVHGDIKPDNLRWREPLGREGNRLCLLDFGLAHPEGRPPEEKILGTPHYMAPERLLGGRLDRRGDLYSFGVLAYQLLTGILPFDGNRHTEVFEGHLRTEAIDPRTIAPAVPAPIAQLLLSLLEKRAEDRPADAEEVRSLLLESWPHRDASPESRTSLLAHIRLRGGTEWQSITDAASRHFADRVEWTSPIHEAWSRTAAPDLLPGAESPLRSIAASTQRSGMLLVEADHASDRRLARREIIRELQVRGARILPWNLRRADGVQELAVEIEALDGSRPSRAPSGRIAAGTLLRAISARAACHPIVVLAEGLESADPVTIEVLKEVVAQERRIVDLDRVLWIGFAGRETNAWASDWLDRPDTRAWVERMPVPTLTEEILRLGVRRRLPGLTLDDDEVGRLLESCDGGHGPLESVLAARIRRGELARPRGHWSWERLPDSAELPIVRRTRSGLRRLGDSQRAVLSLIAVAGGGVSVPILRELLALGAGELPGLLASLVRERWLRRDASRGEYAFVREFQRLACLVDLAPDRRRQWHTALGRSLASSLPSEASLEERARVAEHQVEAEDPSGGARGLIRLIARHDEFSDPGVPLRLGRRLDELCRTDRVTGLDRSERVRLHRALGEMLLRRGDPTAAEAEWRYAEECLAGSPDAIVPRAELSLLLGGLLLRDGRPEEGLPILERTLSLLPTEVAPGLVRGHWRLIAEGSLLRGRPEEAAEAWVALGRLPAPSDPRDRAIELGLFTDHAIALGQTIRAEQLLRAGLPSLEEGGTGLAPWVSRLLGRRALLAGRVADAELAYRLAADLFARERRPLEESRVLLDLAEVQRLRGRRTRAERTLDRAEDLQGRAGGRSERSRLLWVRAALMTDGGWIREARGGLVEIARRAPNDPDPRWRWEAALLEAELMLRMGELARAGRLLDGAAHPGERTGEWADGWVRWGALRARLALRCGDPRAALTTLDTATAESREHLAPERLAPLWRERARILRTLGAKTEAERIEGHLPAAGPDPWIDAEPSGEEHAAALLDAGRAAARRGDANEAVQLHEEALFHALRVRALPLSATIPLRLSLLRGGDATRAERSARLGWRKLVRSGVELGRIELLALWAEARETVGDHQAAAGLRRAAGRQLLRWGAASPLSTTAAALIEGLGGGEEILAAAGIAPGESLSAEAPRRDRGVPSS